MKQRVIKYFRINQLSSLIKTATTLQATTNQMSYLAIMWTYEGKILIRIHEVIHRWSLRLIFKEILRGRKPSLKMRRDAVLVLVLVCSNQSASITRPTASFVLSTIKPFVAPIKNWFWTNWRLESTGVRQNRFRLLLVKLLSKLLKSPILKVLKFGIAVMNY